MLKFIYDAYHDRTGNLDVPEPLKMKREMRSRREASELKSYCTKNRYLVGIRMKLMPVSVYLKKSSIVCLFTCEGTLSVTKIALVFWSA